jgi:hypothetical protein
MTFSTGTEPVAVVTGDFRGAGKLDLAVTNLTSSNVSILLGNGDGTFQNAVNYPASTNPRNLAVGRFRGSQAPLDLVVVNHGDFSTTSSVNILLGNGNGTFRSGASYTVGQNSDAESVAVGDFRGIGKLDLAVADYRSGTVNVLLGNGDGTFQPGVTYSAGTNPLSVAVGDFNSDGRPDLVVANRFSGTVSVLLGNGNGTFQSPVSFNAGTEPFALAVSRFRGNSSPQDIAVVSRSGNTVSVLLGNGNGTFQSPVSYATGTSPWSVAVADFNRDGNPDLVVANRGGFGDNGTISVLLGNGDGTFQSAVNSDSGGQQPFSVATGDFNGDGAPDVVVTNRLSNNVGVLLNQQGATHFALSSPASVTAGTAFSLTVSALTASGTVDPNYRGTVTFSSTDGQATLPANYTFTAADAGVHVFSNGVTLKTAGSQTVTARDTATATITGSATIGVTPAAASVLALTGLPASVTAGTAQSVTVTARDPYNNIATGYTGTVTFSSSDNQATVPANYTFAATDAGVHTFTNAVVLKTAGSQTVTARDTVTATLTGTAGTMVTAAAASTLALTGLPASVTAGAAQSVTVTLRDAYNNIATGYVGTVAFSSTDGQATLPANYTFTATDAGVHTFTNGVILKTAGSRTVTVRDTVTATITNTAGTIVSPAAASVLALTGLPATVTAGTAFSLTVTALDPYGNVATSYRGTVAFSGTDNQATLPTNYPFTAADAGVHTFSNGVTLRTAGSRMITARDTVTATITGSAGVSVTAAAASVLALTGLPLSVTAGTPQSVTVTAQDAYGNVATSYRGTVAFTSTDGQATLPANYTFTATDAGVHTFTNAVVLKTAGSRTVTVRDTVTMTITASAGTMVTPAAASTLALTGLPASVTAGAAQSVTVTLRDAYNNIATGYQGTVAFSSTDGQAMLPANYTFMGADAGVHTFPNGVVLKTAGSQTVTARDTVTATITGSATATVVSAAASTLALTGLPASVTAGTAQSVTVTLRDAYNNIATGYRGTVTFSSSDNQATIPANYTFTASDAGVHTFTNAVILKTAGSQTITARDTVTATITGTTGTMVTPAAASTLALTGLPTSVTAGAAQNVTVTLRDLYNNIATGYRGTVSFSSTDGQATLPANYTFSAADAGVHTFTNGVILRTAGNQTVTARDTITATITGSASTTVVPGALDHFRVVSAATAIAGTPFDFTVTAQDAFNNTVTGYHGTVHFSSGDPAGATLPANYTFTTGTGGDNGTHTFAAGATLFTAGTWDITATDTTTGATGHSNVTVSAAAADHFLVATSVNTTVAGTPFDFTVTVQDAYGNTVLGYTGTVRFSSADPFGATLPGNYTFTTGTGGDNGTHTFPGGATLYTAGSWDVTATDTNNPALAGSALVNVIAAPAVAFTISAPATAMTGVPFDFSVTATDPFGNTDTSYTGTVVFSTMDPAGTFSPASYTFQPTDQGRAVFPQGATLNTVGTWDVTATDTNDSTITGSAFVNVPAGPGIGSRLGVTASVANNGAGLTSSSNPSLMSVPVSRSGEHSSRDRFFASLTGTDHGPATSEPALSHVRAITHDLIFLLGEDAWLDGIAACLEA